MCRICKDVLTTLAKSKDAKALARYSSCNSGHFIITISTFSDVTEDIFKCNLRSFSSGPLETESMKSWVSEPFSPEISKDLRFTNRPMACIARGPNFPYMAISKNWRLSASLSTWLKTSLSEQTTSFCRGRPLQKRCWKLASFKQLYPMWSSVRWAALLAIWTRPREVR